MNGKQLKNSILQWAIQGKLVPQDPNDEPASVLLERIRAEKARLVKEGKIKKDKNESIIFRGDDNSYYEKFLATGEVKCIDDEIPFEIPKGWEWCRGRHIFLPMQSTKPEGEYFTYIDIDAVNNKAYIVDKPKRLPCSQAPSRATRKLEQNCILFSMVRPYLRNIALIGYEHKDAIASTGFYVIRPCSVLYPQYIFKLLLSAYVVDGLNQYMKGDNSPSINNEHIESYLYPIPPYCEQRRIVEKLDGVLPIVAKYDWSQSELDKLNEQLYEKLKKSILQEAIQGKLVPQDPADEPASVLLERIREEKQRLLKEGKLKKKDITDSIIFKGDDNKYYERINGKLLDVSDEIPFDIPGSWRWARIKALFQTTSGGTPEKGHPEYYGGDIPWVKVGDLTDIYLAEASETISQSGYQNSSAKLFPAGTILVAMYCNDAIGKSSILTNPMTTNQAICGLYPNAHLCKEYIYYAIQANKGRLQEQAAGGAQKNINQKIVNELLLPIPPREEQDRILNRIRDINNCL